MIPYGKQNISEQDINAVIDVLKSDYITQGPVVPQFEKTLSDYVGVDYCVAVNSATSALHIALLSLGVGSGDIVWTSPVSFVASANCALYCGASVGFVDIDHKTMNMDMNLLEDKLSDAHTKGELPKVVIPVHLTGRSCDMRRLAELSKQYGFKIVEDASHAVGAKFLGNYVGSCEFSDIVVFSFHPVKIITTGEGGAALTNSRDLMQTMSMLRSHGITRDNELMSKSDGRWYYEQQLLGFNYRMTEIQAALGVSQMLRLEEFVEQRKMLSLRYFELLEETDLILPQMDDDEYSSAWHLFVVRLGDENGSAERRDLYDRLTLEGIGVNVHYIPIYRQPFYKKMGYVPEDYPQSERYYSCAISIPIYYDLTENSQDFVVETLIKPGGFQTIF